MSGWIFIKNLVYWELEMEKSDSPEMQEVLQSQKSEANTEFFKFISRNYATWVNPKSTDGPVMSHTLLSLKCCLIWKKELLYFLY